MAELRKYGVATTMTFPLIARGVADLISSAVTFSAGKCKISKDGGAFANTTSLPAQIGTAGGFTLSLTAIEMQAARIIVTIIDTASPKVWEDQAIVIDTYGNASAQHELDLDIANGWAGVADELLRRSISNVEPGAAFRTLYGAIASLVNRARINAAGNLEVYQTDDATVLSTLTATTDAAQQPIKELDPP